MKLFRKVVDEREELEMMRVERTSYYVTFAALLIAIIVQNVLYDFELMPIAGEFIALIAGAVWMCIGFVRRGIWDYHTKPGMKTYLVYSLLGALVFGSLMPLMRYLADGMTLQLVLPIFAINFVSIFALIFVTMLIYGESVKRRRKKLDEKFD
jgi:hypothetical protein